jgi:hypothetical protein
MFKSALRSILFGTFYYKQKESGYIIGGSVLKVFKLNYLGLII